MKIPSLKELFKGQNFGRDIILLGARWGLRYKLSYRDLVEMTAARGLAVVQPSSRFAPEPLGLMVYVFGILLFWRKMRATKIFAINTIGRCESQ